MKQHLETVSSSDRKKFEKEVNSLMEEGYILKSSHIAGSEVGTYNESSIYQAILVIDINEETKQTEDFGINVNDLNSMTDEKLKQIAKKIAKIK